MTKKSLKKSFNSISEWSLVVEGGLKRLSHILLVLVLYKLRLAEDEKVFDDELFIIGFCYTNGLYRLPIDDSPLQVYIPMIFVYTWKATHVCRLSKRFTF